ncbi:MAG TPA: alpha/beta hydrolase [Sphingobacteriaceae bacterium]
MVIYFLSGLGCDRRVFERIDLPSGYEMQHLDWVPVDGTETLPAYAAQLSKKIDDSKPFMLAGMSFGGMVAAEIAKIKRPEKLILFSTVANRRQLPLFYRLSGKIPLEWLSARAANLLSMSYLHRYFGPLDRRSKELVTEYFRHLDPVFLRWTLGHIGRWQNEEVFPGYLHIHGSEDKTFYARLTDAQYIIPGGGHFCILTHAQKVNEILRKELQPL